MKVFFFYRKLSVARGYSLRSSTSHWRYTVEGVGVELNQKDFISNSRRGTFDGKEVTRTDGTRSFTFTQKTYRWRRFNFY